jgi:hypothetical protein
MRRPRLAIRAAWSAALGAAFAAGCASVLGVSSEPGHVEDAICATYTALCAGRLDDSIVFGTSASCTDAMAAAASLPDRVTRLGSAGCLRATCCSAYLQCLLGAGFFDPAPSSQRPTIEAPCAGTCPPGSSANACGAWTCADGLYCDPLGDVCRMCTPGKPCAGPDLCAAADAGPGDAKADAADAADANDGSHVAGK